MRIFAVILLPILLFLSGCASVQTSELYSLPKLSDEYLSLQALIDIELDEGSDYAAPTRGNNRQSVQLYNIDGEGESEALAFFRTSDGTLKIIIYSFDGVNYSPVSLITGDASSIGRIEFSDLDSDGISEILVAWEMGSGVSILNVYSQINWSSSVLLTAQSYGFTVTQLNSERERELAVLSQDADGMFSLQLFNLNSTGEMMPSTAILSPDFVSASRMSQEVISETTSALVVEGKNAEGKTITDVFIFKSGEFVNISDPAEPSPVSIRDEEVFSEDIDGDGIIEIPYTRKANRSDYMLYDWRTLNSSGNTLYKLTTFHNYNDSWYFVLPESLRFSFSVRRESFVSGESVIVISEVRDDEIVDLFSIYTLTGQNRHERAEFGGRVILSQDEATIYSVKLHSDDFSVEDIKDRFHSIQYEWISPVM